MLSDITQAEFGMELYEAIATCSQIQQLLRMISAEVWKGKDPSDLSAQYSRLKAQAKKLVAQESILDEDAARLLRQYPWLGQ
jgi:hypothetical protein